MDQQRWCFMGLVVDNRRESAPGIQELLTEYGHIIMGRMGVPLRGQHVCAISLIVDGSSAEAGELETKLAELPGVEATSCYATAQPGRDGLEAEEMLHTKSSGKERRPELGTRPYGLGPHGVCLVSCPPE